MARSRVVLPVFALVLAHLLLRLRVARADDADTFSAHPAGATTADPGSGSLTEKPVAERLVPKAAGGFVLLNGALQSVPSATARNKTDYSMAATIGVSASGNPWEHWEYLAYVTSSISTDAVNGTSGAVSPEQITVAYRAFKEFSIQVGYLRIPFSIGQATAITNSMFPTRPEPTALFQGGADAGILAGYESPQGRIKVKGGLFDGVSLTSAVPGDTVRGPVLSTWAELAPLGGMTPLEGDFNGSPFRFALSSGFVYRKGTAFDPTGYEGVGFDDTRLSLAARLAFKGFYAQGEYLQDRFIDNLASRLRISRGAYGEASYHVLVKTIGLAPLTRLGWSVQDEGFYPLHDVTAHAGLALYPRGDLANRGGVRLTLEYESERHIEDREVGYGALASIMARF